MAIVATQIREANGTYRESFEDGPGGYVGLREYLVSGASTLAEAVTGAVSGLPARGDPWSVDYPGCQALTRKAEWIVVNRIGEALGRIKVSVPYGPPNFASVSDNPAPTRAGQTWSEYGIGTISQPVMYGFNVGTTTHLNAPIDNGRGVNLDVGILVLKVSKAYAPNAAIPISQFLGLMRPSKVNDHDIVVPSPFGRTNALAFTAGQLLYKSHAIELRNSLTIVTHELWASEDWLYSWVQESEDGEPLARNTVEIYEKASFAGLW